MHKKTQSRTLRVSTSKVIKLISLKGKKDHRSKSCLTIERKQKTADGWTKQVVGLTAPSS